MLPPNIDLTENSDFGLGSGIFMDTPVDLDDLDTRNNMSIDEYDYLVWWEDIFGKRRHPSIKRILFPKLGYDVPNLPRIPWESWSPFNTTPSTYEKIPWINNYHQVDDRGYNLFNRR